MSTRQVKAGEAYVEIGIRNRLAKGAAAVQADLNKLSRKLTSVGSMVLGIGASVSAPFVAASIKFAGVGDEADKMSKRVGVSIQTLTALGFAAEQSGSSLSAIEKGFAGQSRSLLDLSLGGQAAVDTYDALGLTLEELQSLSPEQRFYRTADALAAVQDESTRAALAQRIFGRAGRELLPLLNEQSQGIATLMEEARELGRVLSNEDAKAAADFTDAMNRVKSTVSGLVIQVGGALAPAFTDLSNDIAEVGKGVTGFIRDNQAAVQAIALAAGVTALFGAALITTGAAASAASTGIGVVTGAVGLLTGAGTTLSVMFGIVQALTYSTAAAFALASGTANGTAAAIGLLSAAEAANATATAIATAAYGAMGTVLAVLTGQVGIAAAATSVFGGIFATVSAAVSAGWALMTSPILPFLVAGAAVVALLGTAAVMAIDFGGAFDKAKSMVGGIIGVLKEVFDTMKAVLSTGDYEQAGKALWASLQLIFWEGVGGTMNAFQWLWDEAWATGKRFLNNLLDLVSVTFSAIGKAILNPLQAAKEIQAATANLVSGATSFDPSSLADAARAELAAIRETVKAEKERNEQIEKRNQAGDSVNDDPMGEEQQSSYERQIKSINMEIVALQQGEAAAERMRLAEEGLTDAQIKQVEALKAKRDAIQKLKDTQKEQQELAEKAKRERSENRVEQIFKRAVELEEKGLGPDEIFQRVMRQIDTDEQSGRIDSESASGARKEARANLEDRIDRLKDEGRALAEALMTPAEELNKELKRISFLQDQGTISDDIALRAEDEARKRFAEQTGKEIDKQVATGPTGTFSAFAAGVMGLGQMAPDTKELKTQTVILRKIEKNVGKSARWSR